MTFLHNGVKYTIKNDYAIVGDGSTNNHNAYTTCPTDIVIPQQVTYNNSVYTVKEIGERAFYRCTNVNSISLPNTIVKFGQSSFDLMFYSGTIYFPESLEHIDNWCFASNEIRKFHINSKLKYIGKGAFGYSAALTGYTISNSEYFSVDEKKALFSINKDRLISVPQCITEYTIPNTVRIIDALAFSYSKCTEIVIPPNVKSVTDRCFAKSIVTVLCFHGNTDILHNAFEATHKLIDLSAGANI